MVLVVLERALWQVLLRRNLIGICLDSGAIYRAFAIVALFDNRNIKIDDTDDLLKLGK